MHEAQSNLVVNLRRGGCDICTKKELFLQACQRS